MFDIFSFLLIRLCVMRSFYQWLTLYFHIPLIIVPIIGVLYENRFCCESFCLSYENGFVFFIQIHTNLDITFCFNKKHKKNNKTNKNLLIKHKSKLVKTSNNLSFIFFFFVEVLNGIWIVANKLQNHITDWIATLSQSTLSRTI